MNNLATTIKATEKSFDKKATGAMTFDKEAFFAMQALSKNAFTHKVALASPETLQAAMINVAAIGLSLNPANQDAYLVPRDGAICLDISYKGLIKLATNTGSIKWAQAEIVYDSDSFKFMGVGVKPEHESNPFGDRGEPVGVYCVAKTHDGDYLTTTMDKAEIEAVRATSKAATSANGGQYSPWATFPMEMWKKSVIKRASKQWPKTDLNGADVMSHAIEVLNEHEGNNFEPAASEEQLKYYEQLVKEENTIGIYCFYQSLEVEVQVSLSSQYVKKYAEKGGIGKLKERLKELKNAGMSIVFKYRDEFESSDDESAMNELISELSTDEFNFIFELLTPDAQAKINQLQDAA